MHNTRVIPSSLIEGQPRYLWLIMLTYSMVITLSNWFDPRLISMWGLNTDAGTLIFPFTFLLSDLITEVYGYKNARRAIWCGYLFNMFFILYGQVVIHMPSPDYPTNNALFDTILATNTRVFFAGFSYFVSEPLNSFTMAKLKIKMSGRYLGIRFVTSTIVSSGIDGILFSVIAFYGTMGNMDLVNLILSGWLIKVVIEILGLPLSIRLAKKLKTMEHLDIYDKRTSFNIFSLNADYALSDNEYKK
ncbi:MAG: VUT family protein [Gammaproteobacteria bacterium]|nr:MAG: VUT family protein [Gammaproteobacteria bacterium]